MSLKQDEWVWVLVGGREGDARFVGLAESEEGESVIPAYQDKEAAKAGFEGLDRGTESAFEVQAIRYGDLCRRAGESGFSVAVISADGKIVEKKNP